jgi:hypothetical protein
VPNADSPGDSSLSARRGRMFRVIATVGSMPADNDDLPNEGLVTVNRSLELGIA